MSLLTQSYKYTNSDKTKTYDKTKKTAYDSVRNATASFNTTYTSMGAGFGWDATSKLAGAGFGLFADLISWGIRDSEAKADARKNLENRADNAKSAYEATMKELSNTRLQATNFINRTKSTFDATFGADSYDMYDSLFTTYNGSGYSLDSLIQQMQTNSDITQADSVNTLLEMMTDEQREKLLTNNLSINDINDSYYNFLAEQFGSANTQYGYQMRSLSNKEAYLNEQNREQLSNMRAQYAQQIENAVTEQQLKNISGAEQLGNIESQAGSSGIRQTGKGSNQAILQKYETALSAVAYASTLNYMINQYENSIKSTQSGYMYQAYELRNSMNQSTQSQIASYVEQGNQKQSSLIDTVYKIESAYDEAIAQVMEYQAVNDAMKQIDDEDEQARLEAQKNQQTTYVDEDANDQDNDEDERITSNENVASYGAQKQKEDFTVKTSNPYKPQYDPYVTSLTYNGSPFNAFEQGSKFNTLFDQFSPQSNEEEKKDKNKTDNVYVAEDVAY